MILDWRETLCPRMTPQAARLLRGLSMEQAEALEEIRFRCGRPVELVIDGHAFEQPMVTQRRDMDELLAALSGYALYACENQMAQGYIPLEGGHRAGVCGHMTLQDGAARMSGVTSICVRVARHVEGASAPIRAHLLTEEGRARRVLLLGAPGCGKTTVLRDAALYLSDEAGLHVTVADEREELFARYPPDGRGKRLDVLGGMGKAQAFALLIRTMAPQVIVTDEVGKREDTAALLDAARCGVGLLASAHADGLEDAMERPVLRELIDARAFERYIHLGRHGRVLGVWDGTRRPMKRGRMDGELGCGRDGDDRHQRDRFFAGGRGEAACALDTGHAPVSAAHEQYHSL